MDKKPLTFKITIKCPFCRTNVVYDPEKTYKAEKCPKCKAKFEYELPLDWAGHAIREGEEFE